MAEKYPSTFIVTFDHPFATDLAPQVRQVNHFTTAQNGLFETDGSFHKAGGSTRINATAITSSPNVMGMFDYHRAGTTGTFGQKFMAVTSDSKVYKEDMDGTFDDITGAATIGAGAVPVFCVFDDILTIWFSDNSTPLSWNQTGNVATLAGSPAAGRGAVAHANRLWSWGDNSNPSRMSYSAYGDPETHSGSDAGFLDIAVSDGDRVTGAISYKGTLAVFKGPNKGSIHFIEGLTPGDFEVPPNTVRGIALHSHNSIIPVGDDFWLMSRRGIHSLKATFATGNYAMADVSRYQHKFFRDTASLTDANLARVWGVNYASKSCAMWTLTQSAQTDPAILFGVSYINPQELKPFIWTGRSCFSAAMRIHQTSRLEEVIFGTTDGFCERQDTSNRSLANNSSIPYVVQTPQIILAPPEPRGDQTVSLERAYLKSEPFGNWDVTLEVQRDGNAGETYNFNQGLASFILDTSILDVDSLGGNVAQTVVANLAGTCRSATFTLKQNGVNQDVNLYELGIDYKPVATTSEST